MRTWLAKYKISSALDLGQSLPPSLRRRMEASAELRAFARNADALDHALKQDLPEVEPPAFLHASIMRAVEQSSRPVPRRSLAWRWLPAPAFAIAILLAAWWGLHLSTPKPVQQPQWAASSTANTAPTLNEQVTRTVTTALVSPLSDEWQRLDLDLNKAMDFLSASLP
jgi:hypothetical protein